jgi:hypothetical protein
MAEPTKAPTGEAKAAEPLMTTGDMRKLVDDYHIPMSDSSLTEMGAGMTPEKGKSFEDFVKTTAQGLYPTLAPQIKSGIPTKHLVEPYRQVAKQMLGDEHELDFIGDPKASAALTDGFDPTTQRPAPMSLNQWKSHIQSHPGFGWESTPNGQQWNQSVAQSINQIFSKEE